MDMLDRILQKSKLHGTYAGIGLNSNIVLKYYCSILVPNKRIPNQTKLVEKLLRAMHVTPIGKPSLTQKQRLEQSGKTSAKLRQQTQPPKNFKIGLSHLV